MRIQTKFDGTEVALTASGHACSAHVWVVMSRTGLDFLLAVGRRFNVMVDWVVSRVGSLSLSVSRWAQFRKSPVRTPFSRLTSLLALYSRASSQSESLLAEKIASIRFEGQLNPSEEKWLSRLKSLSRLRGLAFGRPAVGSAWLWQNFAYQKEAPEYWDVNGLLDLEEVAPNDIAYAATQVAALYWQLYDTAASAEPELRTLAKKLYRELFGVDFDVELARAWLEYLTDAMQREGGIPFLMMNLLRRGQMGAARVLGQRLINEEIELDEELRSSLYWLAELTWFTNSVSPVSDFESSIRYLYHMCFTNPERAGFLEIDSQFFSQFETVSEHAREGFLFKESMVERFLNLWNDYEGFFDLQFQSILEEVTRKKSKIYDERDAWSKMWLREKENFSKEYLYVVEGNLSYVSGNYLDAKAYYEKALGVNPELRSALLNLVFCFARLGEEDSHELLAQKLASKKALHPSVWYVLGNSFTLANRYEEAEGYFNKLRKVSGWEKKVDHYRSTFAYENGMHQEALKFALAAANELPDDVGINYHLSLCHVAVGNLNEALAAVKKISRTAKTERWLDFFRFTLERDTGNVKEARKTLLGLPIEYFEDSDELDTAMRFARDHQDLVLLRHLRGRN